MNYSRRALKQEVRRNMKMVRPDARLVTLVYLVASFVLTSVVDLVHAASIPDPVEMMLRVQELAQMLELGQIGSQRMLEELLAMRSQFGGLAGGAAMFGLLSSAVTWTLTYGYDGYCLNMVRGKQPGFLTLLCAFPKWGWVLLSGFLISFFMGLWAVLLCILGVVATVALLLFIPEGTMGITLIIVVWVLILVWLLSIALGYAMTNYILLDDKVDALEAITRSKAMMRGRKRHLFVLGLSFFGWLLLAGLVGAIVSAVVSAVTGGGAFGEVSMAISGLTGGVAASDVVTWLVTLPFMVWVQPYMTGSIARFYDMMRHTDIAYGEWEGRITPVKKARRQAAPQPGSHEDAPLVPRYEDPVPEGSELPELPEEPGEKTPEPAVPDRPDYE